MTGNAPTHTCSYFCDKPECIKAQRDELRDKLAAIESQPVPVEPVAQYEGVDMSRYTIAWVNSPPLNLSNLHTIYDENNPWPHIPVGTKLYSQSAIDSLQSAPWAGRRD